MSRVKELYDLQELDQQLESNRQSLSGVESRLGESSAIIDARAELAREEERLEEMQHLYRRVEFDMEDLQVKIAASDDKLYGGAVKNPKELLSLRDQADIHRRKVGEIEDRLLELMSDIESSERKISSQREQIAHMEDEWRKDQESLTVQGDELAAAIARLESERNARAAKIEKSHLELYEKLRSGRQGRAVAKIEQGLCQGCRISLPSNKLQQVKSGKDLVQCGSCERILYLS